MAQGLRRDDPRPCHHLAGPPPPAPLCPASHWHAGPAAARLGPPWPSPAGGHARAGRTATVAGSLRSHERGGRPRVLRPALPPPIGSELSVSAESRSGRPEPVSVASRGERRLRRLPWTISVFVSCPLPRPQFLCPSVLPRPQFLCPSALPRPQFLCPSVRPSALQSNQPASLSLPSVPAALCISPRVALKPSPIQQSLPGAPLSVSAGGSPHP